MWDKTSKALKDILDANSLLDNVYNYEASQLDGSPVATLTPSANENDYVTTVENRRVYAFLVRLYVRRDSGKDNEYNTEAAMRELVDDVLDDFDKNHRLSAIESKTGYTYLFMEAAPSTWGYVGRDNEYRVAEINLRIHFDVDVTAIA